jgi:hypothetical protein
MAQRTNRFPKHHYEFVEQLELGLTQWCITDTIRSSARGELDDPTATVDPKRAVAKDWAVPHLLAGRRLSPGMTMIFGPRDETELDIVTAIVLASFQFATQLA